MVIYDRERKQMLVNLRGDKRRAMELAINKANAQYTKLELAAEEQVNALLPAINDAYETYYKAHLLLVDAFIAALPEAVKPNVTHRPDPTNIRNNPHYYSNFRQEASAARYALSQELYKLREFLLAKQTTAPKVKSDAPAVKLIEEFDASRQLTAGSEPTAVTHPDGTISPEIV